MQNRIMYVCSECADSSPESCGHFDRNDLRVMPNGQWLCDECFDDTTQADRGNYDEYKYIGWCDMPAPEECILSSQSDHVSCSGNTDGGEPVAWRYRCHDGGQSFVLLEKRLTDVQKTRGYYVGEDGDDYAEDDDAITGPFYWTEETPLYSHPALEAENESIRVGAANSGGGE